VLDRFFVVVLRKPWVVLYRWRRVLLFQQGLQGVQARTFAGDHRAVFEHAA